MSHRWLGTTVLLVLVELGAGGGFAQQASDNALLLVAHPNLPDPLFRDSVVLMLPPQPGQRLVAGLIINKPTRLTLAQVFPDEKALQGRTDFVYFGGPVGIDKPGAVFRSQKPPKEAAHLFADLYVTFDSDAVLGMLQKPEPDTGMRIFLGRSQWAPTQLQTEMIRGAWYTERAGSSDESGWIFSTDPANVWQALLARAQPKSIAQRTEPGAAVPVDNALDGPLNFRYFHETVRPVIFVQEKGLE